MIDAAKADVVSGAVAHKYPVGLFRKVFRHAKDLGQKRVVLVRGQKPFEPVAVFSGSLRVFQVVEPARKGLLLIPGCGPCCYFLRVCPACPL